MLNTSESIAQFHAPVTLLQLEELSPSWLRLTHVKFYLKKKKKVAPKAAGV